LIRLAISEDAISCFNLAKEMYSEFLNRHGIEVNDDDLMQTVENFIVQDQVLVIDRDGVVGMCAWIVTGHPANQSMRIFQEVLWCSNSEHKTDAFALLRVMQDKAREVKADIVVLANLSLENEPKLRRIYGRMGFQYLETHYARAN